MNELKLTKQERAAIKLLRKLEAIWPETLWLFVDGNIHVVRLVSRERVVTSSGGYDPECVIETITDIPCDGGAW